MAITFDDTSVASHPGEIKISSRKFLDYFGIKGLRRIYYLGVFKMPLNSLNLLMKNNRIVHEWMEKTEQFKFGCLNPSMVIDSDKGIIATYTNLTNDGSVPTSVIKISSEKLHLVVGPKFVNGQKIPSVAFYYPNQENPNATSWSDFDPAVPHCFSDNNSACDKLLTRLNEKHWLCLKIGLGQVKNPSEIGLYSVEIDTEIVNLAY